MKKLYAFLTFLLFGIGAYAQTFTTFSGANLPSIHPGILETTTATYKEFRLTTTSPIEQKAAVWHDGALSLTGNWTRKAALNFGPFDETNLDGTKTGIYKSGADGIGMVLSTAKYLGQWGEEVGYGTRDVLAGTYTPNNSLAFEMDTWKNETRGFAGSEGYLDHLERDGNHVAFMANGNTIHNNAVPPPTTTVGFLRTLTFDLEIAGWIDVELTWTDNAAAGMGGTLSVSSPSHPNLNSSIVLSEAQLTSYFGSITPTLFMGFSSATGSAGNDHRVRWVLNPPPPPADCGQLRTQTQGGWGQSCNGGNNGCYRDANFATAFPMGARIGSTAMGGRSLLFTTSLSVENFLPSNGPSKTLAQLGLPAGQTTNPSGNSQETGRSNINGQLLALTLSVRFDDVDPNFGAAGVKLGDMIIGSGAYAGWTVRAFLAYGNSYIGGSGTDADIISNIQTTATSINENYVDGKTDKGFLNCPTAPRVRPAATTIDAVTALSASVYPNPSRGQLNVNLGKIPAGSEIQVINSRGAVVARRAAGGAQSVAFDVSKYGTGVYLVKIISGSNVQTMKAIVQ